MARKFLHVTERVPFGNGEWQSHDTLIAVAHIIAIRPSPDGCVIIATDGEAFDTANDPYALLDLMS